MLRSKYEAGAFRSALINALAESGVMMTSVAMKLVSTIIADAREDALLDPMDVTKATDMIPFDSIQRTLNDYAPVLPHGNTIRIDTMAAFDDSKFYPDLTTPVECRVHAEIRDAVGESMERCRHRHQSVMEGLSTEEAARSTRHGVVR